MSLYFALGIAAASFFGKCFSAPLEVLSKKDIANSPTADSDTEAKNEFRILNESYRLKVKGGRWNAQKTYCIHRSKVFGDWHVYLIDFCTLSRPIMAHHFNLKTMYKDIISYALAEGITHEHLISIAKQIVDDWMSKQRGFVKWEIHTNSDGSYTDIVYWESKEDAKNSEKEMVNIPNSGEWFACYKLGSISSKNLSLVAKF